MCSKRYNKLLWGKACLSKWSWTNGFLELGTRIPKEMIEESEWLLCRLDAL